MNDVTSPTHEPESRSDAEKVEGSPRFDAVLDVIANVRVDTTYLDDARRIVADMRARNGLPAKEKIFFHNAFEQFDGELAGGLVMFHDLSEDGINQGLYVIIPPGWWWFDDITPDQYRDLMTRAKSAQGQG